MAEICRGIYVAVSLIHLARPKRADGPTGVACGSWWRASAAAQCACENARRIKRLSSAAVIAKPIGGVAYRAAHLRPLSTFSVTYWVTITESLRVADYRAAGGSKSIEKWGYQSIRSGILVMRRVKAKRRRSTLSIAPWPIARSAFVVLAW